MMRGGILNIRKPTGPTSHDIASHVRRILRTRRVGHAGTLDPLAEGVLLICVDQATRLVEYLHHLPKHYVAGVRFGQTTDTLDITGSVIETRDASALTLDQVSKALQRFRGPIMQVPPMYSAIKLQGRPLYERARRGEVVDRAPRPATVHRLEVGGFVAGPLAECILEASCSSGTYIRALCHDLGQSLGTGAIMTSLVRTGIGPFELADAVEIERLQRLAECGGLIPWVSPTVALPHVSRRIATADEQRALSQGRLVADELGTVGSTRLILNEMDDLIAIGQCVESGGSIALRPLKVFSISDAAD